MYSYSDGKIIWQPLVIQLTDFIGYKYFIQAALYHHALNGFRIQQNLLKYKIVDYFDFVVANTFEEPIIFRVESELLNLGMVGGTLRNGRKIRGIKDLITDYKWHVENQLFDYPAKIYQNNGVKIIDIL